MPSPLTGNPPCRAFLRAQFLILATPPGSAVSDEGLRLPAQVTLEARVQTGLFTRKTPTLHSSERQRGHMCSDKWVNTWYVHIAEY